MAVRLEITERHYVDFGQDGGGRNVVVPFPPIHRYEQIQAEVDGYDPHETGAVSTRIHYGFSPHPVIRIANVVSSRSTPIRRLDSDADGRLWLLCHRHRTAAESAAYASAVMMGRDPEDGLAPAAIEYVAQDGHYTIVARRPPYGAPSGFIVHSVSHDDRDGPRILTVASDMDGLPVSPEAYLFPYIPLPAGGVSPRSDA